MSEIRNTRNVMLEAMARHALEHGLSAASLRPLAKAAGTSDRMLIYHFGSKDRLVDELLHFLASDLAAKLDGSLPPNRALSVHDCVTEIIGLLRSKPFHAYTRIWLDIVAKASCGDGSHRRVGGGIIDGYTDWLEKRLPADTPDMAGTVALVLTVIEGTMVMDAIGRSLLADAARERLFAC
ncbi:MAG: TetR/AcrR family transcriptional regulator [Beijerinckiaceae bacterium]|nr:TetR/AcrR family transcriptional regulator [Beijerinckiaceae bacterium]MCZ8298981.1 TetR/AcrR family transcriptional regulator [Beijerinckiaceae bacterium]